MKKRLAVALVVILALMLTATMAYAATGEEDFFNRMFNAHKQWINQAVESKRLTPEQGQAWNNHFAQMQKFHETSGFACPGPGMMGGYFNGGQADNNL